MAPTTQNEAKDHFLKATNGLNDKQSITVNVGVLRLACGATAEPGQSQPSETGKKTTRKKASS